ncbi:amino-acid permease [Fusarium phyllophilum]|uniref:Amino-acid permease n=1 Tax=Fusarium phyllophilum TaxID=47803 RepID=A0A8H5IC15_9HYPO|nr:amino-acid permease [Fusarium phyllophilum]
MSVIREDGQDNPVNAGGDARGNSTDTSSDNILLEKLGYKPVLERSFNQFHNFATTFAALYFIGGVRVTFSTGIAAGGNLAYWTSYIVTCVFTFITAAVIAEICSSLPLAGSIYLWAAEAGGPRYGRLFGFVVAWWSTTAWTTFCASNTQAAVNYMLSEIVVFNTDFPSDSSSVKFRAVQWILTEIMLALACIWNLLPPRYFKWIFGLSSGIVILDFVLNLIWLPIATSNTLGFRSTHDAFMTTYNGTGAPPGWNWCLSYLATAGVLIGFDASGHVAEETKNASVAAARGIFWSTVVSGIGGFIVVILFLFCVPDAKTLFSYGGPQPFVSVYAAILGEGGHIVMNIVCILALWFLNQNTAIAVTAASRLVFAVARDGVLPWSSWVSRVEAGQPRNAVYVVWGVASIITCTILPSAVAFTSLVSAAGVPSAAAYGLISLARLFLTPKNFPKPAWSLGRLSKPFQVIAVFWNGWVVAVLYSPYVFPVTAESLNYAPIIMAGTTILALLTWWFTPAEKWLPSQRIQQTLDADTRISAINSPSILLASSFELSLFGVATFSLAPVQSDWKNADRHPWMRNMGFSDLKWVYGPTHRARDVPNDAVDAYKRIIQQLYLDQNKTREEVLGHLQDSHGFWLSTNQFSKAIKRWGFYGRPRQVQRRRQPPESITEEEEATYPLNPLEELFDFEPDALDTIDETEVGFETGRECATDPQNQQQLSYFGRRFVSEAPPSINDSDPQAVSDDFTCDALPCDTERSLHNISQRDLQQMETTQKFETRPICISSEISAQASLDNHTNKSHVDYLTCCYLFEEAVDCLERSGKSLDKREHRVPRSNIDKLFAPYRRDKDKLLARPNISLDMWSILRLLEQTGEPDDLVDRLDTNDLRFMNAMRECLGLCKKWIELVGKGLPRDALQFDSLFLHPNISKAVQNICRPLHEQGRYDIWKEAGYLFAFIWSNETLKAAHLLSWLEEGEISRLSPSHFLAIICEMIVHITALSSPDFREVSSKGDDGGKPICGLYLQIIEEIKRIKPARTVKRLFIDYFFNRHAGLDLSPEEKRNLESVQSYQRTAENFVFKDERDTVTQKFSVKQIDQLAVVLFQILKPSAGSHFTE